MVFGTRDGAALRYHRCWGLELHQGQVMTVLRRCCVLAVALAAIGCGSARTPPATSPPPPRPVAPTAVEAEATPAPVSMHTVEPGDTLWSLSRRYAVSADDFVRANDLGNPDRLSVGDRLIIPTHAAGGVWLWPVSGGEILSGFGSSRGARVHRGLDIRAYDHQPVVAAWSGVVVYAGANMRDYGNAVILDHGDGLTSLYGHNAELLVSIGDEVGRGEPIALAGRSGNATVVHCHFEVRKNAVAIDPLEFLANAGR